MVGLLESRGGNVIGILPGRRGVGREENVGKFSRGLGVRQRTMIYMWRGGRGIFPRHTIYGRRLNTVKLHLGISTSKYSNTSTTSYN